MSLIVDEHRQYLADPHRLAAFERAIAATVKPGDVVIDLGAGTGILGLFACRAGAARVYAIDDGSIIGLARELGRANGFSDRIVFVKGLSSRIALPEKADAAVSDQIGRFGFEAGVWEYFTDLRARLLKPRASTVPRRIELWMSPVEAPALFEQVEFWSKSPAGFDVSPARALAVNTGYPARLDSEQLLAEPVCLTELDLSEPEPPSIGVEAELSVRRPGTLHGLGGWFRAELAPGIYMSNAPGDAARIDRRNVFLPLDRATAVEAGDRLRVRLRILPSEVMLRWHVTLETAAGDGKAVFSHSTAAGMLLALEDLDRTRPDYVPQLSPWGVARRTLLSLCDGRRPLAEIEAELRRRHPELFASPAAAAGFVAEVVTRYA
jgi:type I protein arginine methyltransferase